MHQEGLHTPGWPGPIWRGEGGWGCQTCVGGTAALLAHCGAGGTHKQMGLSRGGASVWGAKRHASHKGKTRQGEQQEDSTQVLVGVKGVLLSRHLGWHAGVPATGGLHGEQPGQRRTTADYCSGRCGCSCCAAAGGAAAATGATTCAGRGGSGGRGLCSAPAAVGSGWLPGCSPAGGCPSNPPLAKAAAADAAVEPGTSPPLLPPLLPLQPAGAAHGPAADAAGGLSVLRRRTEGHTAHPVQEPTVCHRFASVWPHATSRLRKAATSAGHTQGVGGGEMG